MVRQPISKALDLVRRLTVATESILSPIRKTHRHARDAQPRREIARAKGKDRTGIRLSPAVEGSHLPAVSLKRSVDAKSKSGLDRPHENKNHWINAGVLLLGR